MNINIIFQGDCQHFISADYCFRRNSALCLFFFFCAGDERILLTVLNLDTKNHVKAALDQELQTPLHTLCVLVGGNPNNAKGK